MQIQQLQPQYSVRHTPVHYNITQIDSPINFDYENVTALQFIQYKVLGRQCPFQIPIALAIQYEFHNLNL